MLANKDKKTVCLVVLGVSIASLITAVVSGFVVGMIDFIDELVSMVGYGVSKYFLLDIAYMLQTALGVAFAAVFFFNKKRRNAVNIALSASIAGLFVVFVIVFAALGFFDKAYSSTMSFISLSLTLIVSSALMVVAQRLAQKYGEALSVTENAESETPSADVEENE